MKRKFVVVVVVMEVVVNMLGLSFAGLLFVDCFGLSTRRFKRHKSDNFKLDSA